MGGKSVYLYIILIQRTVEMRKDTQIWLYWIVTKSIARKYAFDIWLFIFTTSVVYIMEFTDFRIPLYLDVDCKTINDIIYFSCSTYSITFIALLVNSISKEWKKYIDMYPHIKTILRRTLGVYSDRISWFISEYEIATNKKSFSFKDEDFNKIIDSYKQEEEIKAYCRHNNVIATQIYYDMEALMKFSDCISSDMLSNIYSISTNLFILKYKDVEYKDLSLYKAIFYKYERELREEYIKLKKHSIKIFGNKVLPKNLAIENFYKNH